MPVVETPCNKVCVIDQSSDLCMGCGRTLAEIAAWTAFTSEQRLRVMAQLPERLATLRSPQPFRTELT